MKGYMYLVVTRHVVVVVMFVIMFVVFVLGGY